VHGAVRAAFGGRGICGCISAEKQRNPKVRAPLAAGQQEQEPRVPVADRAGEDPGARVPGDAAIEPLRRQRRRRFRIRFRVG